MFVLMTTFIVAPAWAQNKEALCQILPVKEYFTSADYIPGVDVHGNPVVAADINAKAENFIDVIKIPVTIDLAAQLNQALPVGTELDAPVGMIEIYQTGRVVFNGKDLTSEIYALCGKKPESEQPVAKPVPVPVIHPVKELEEEIIWGEGY